MPVLILGHTPPSMVSQLISYRITQTVSAQAKAEEYSAAALECGGVLRVHIKVDTGMSRLGFLVRGEHFDGGVEAIDRSCALPGLEAEGIYTHFAVSDEDDADSRGLYPGAVRRVYPGDRRAGRPGPDLRHPALRQQRRR
jgi:alanine racemase